MDRDRQMGNEQMTAWMLDVLREEARAIERLAEYLNPAQMNAMARALDGVAGKVVTAGCGTSGVVAKKVAHTLTCVGRPAFFLSPGDAMHGASGVLTQGDMLLLFSKGGATGELLPMADACRARGATLATVTDNPASPLAMVADVHLRVHVDREADPLDMFATTSTLAAIAAFDAIAVALARANGYTPAQFATIHPHGAVGERLLGNGRGGVCDG